MDRNTRIPTAAGFRDVHGSNEHLFDRISTNLGAAHSEKHFLVFLDIFLASLFIATPIEGHRDR